MSTDSSSCNKLQLYTLYHLHSWLTEHNRLRTPHIDNCAPVDSRTSLDKGSMANMVANEQGLVLQAVTKKGDVNFLEESKQCWCIYSTDQPNLGHKFGKYSPLRTRHVIMLARAAAIRVRR